MEASPQPAVTVRPRPPFLAGIAGLVAAGSIAVAFVAESPRALVTVGVLAALWAGQQLVDRGRLQSVEFRPGVVAISAAYERREITRPAVSRVGYAGAAVAGRLSIPFGQYEPLRTGRLVLLDADGRILAALRAGWFSLTELEEATHHASLSWVGLIDLAEMEFSAARSSSSAEMLDESEVSSLKSMKRLSRRLIVRWTVAWIAWWLLVVALSNAGAPDWVMDPARLAVGLGAVGLAVVAVTQRLRSRPVRRARAVLRAASFEDADVVVLRGAPKDATVRTVVVLDSATGRPVDSWLVEPGPTGQWLQEFDRRSCRLAVGGDGHAVLASAQGQVALLVRSTGLLKSESIRSWATDAMSGPWRAAQSRS